MPPMTSDQQQQQQQQAPEAVNFEERVANAVEHRERSTLARRMDWIAPVSCYATSSVLHTFGFAAPMTIPSIFISGTVMMMSANMLGSPEAREKSEITVSSLETQQMAASMLWSAATVNQFRATPKVAPAACSVVGSSFAIYFVLRNYWL